MKRFTHFGLTFSVLLLLAAFAGPLPAADEETVPAARRIELTIADRAVQGGTNVVRVTQGEAVELVWTTDESVQLHLHGYDIELDLAPGTPGVMAFNARATGRFPVTSHGFGDEHGHGHDTLLYLEVYPE